MEILTVVLLSIIVYFAVRIGLRVYNFWSRYKDIIKTFHDALKGRPFNGSNTSGYTSGSNASGYTSGSNASDSVSSNGVKQKKKIIPKDEGEYIEFEEV